MYFIDIKSDCLTIGDENQEVFTICQCEVAVLPGPEKGIGDWVVARGKKAEKAVSTMIADALRMSDLSQRFFMNRARGLRKFKPDSQYPLSFHSHPLSVSIGVSLLGF